MKIGHFPQGAVLNNFKSLFNGVEQGSGSPLKTFGPKRVSYLALEMIDNRCTSQSASFIKQANLQGRPATIDLSTVEHYGRRLVGKVIPQSHFANF